ncbi:hypothetical protein M0802_000886 [Mischocyttarus mexicanus]|nr:hypothetical protein M0802_000886 [Mischocyttarus mexicanus]
MACGKARNYMDEMLNIITQIDCLKPEPEICNVSCPPLGCPRGPCPGMCCNGVSCDPCCISQMPCCPPIQCLPGCVPVCPMEPPRAEIKLKPNPKKICYFSPIPDCPQISSFPCCPSPCDPPPFCTSPPNCLSSFCPEICQPPLSGCLKDCTTPCEPTACFPTNCRPTLKCNPVPACFRPSKPPCGPVYVCIPPQSMLEQPRNKKDENKNSILPSEYIKQMSLTTEERMAYLIKPGINENLRILLNNSEKNPFKTIPAVIVFQQFLPGNVYNATLTIRNSSQVSRCLKSCCKLDPFFDIEFRGSSYNVTVAPGLAQVYNIKFMPEEKRDYKYETKFVTEDDVITVPIIAIGPRAILDIPDCIEIPNTAVKISSSKTIFIRNIGSTSAIFTFFTDSPRFRIEPSSGLINEEESIQFTIYFLSDIAGEFEANLFLKYETGEILRTELRSSAVNCIIRIDRGSVKMEDTYLGMSRSKILTIHNRSDYIVKYQWMCYESNEKDNAKREEYKKLFELIHKMEIVRNVSLEYYNICMPDIHELVCQRIYGDEIISLMNENFQYNHLCFMITPMEGEIWPHSSSDVTIFFRALEVGEICSTAYLEVSGREERIPLNLCGVGKGPVFRLNVITIDVDKIYMYSVHYYEIVAANKGYIDGTLIYKSKQTDFGGIININPPSLIIKPGEYKSFNLSFSSNRKGEFLERVDFIVKESLEIISLHIKGCVICPTLHFDKKILDFGTTPLGFTSRQEVCLHNLSSVPVTYSITVLNDGVEEPLTYEDFVNSDTKLSFPSNPREFIVQPEEGVVPERSFTKIRIIYNANIIRVERSFVRVDMWNSESDPLMLPISFCGSTAILSIKPSEISIRFCFINFPYTRTFDIENNSDMDSYFYLVPQSVSDNNTSIYYSMSSYQGFIKARQSKTIIVTLITRSLGKQSTTINMLTMGQNSPVIACTLSCTGQGPVVSLQPTQMDFADVQVLEERSMKLRVISDAPIPAQFQVALSRKDSPWSVNPVRGELEANESMELDVKIYLRDAGKYEDNILMTVHNSRTISVNLKAIGVGCSVVFQPNVFPTFDMGLLLSHQKVSIPITMKNLGSRQYQLIWTNTPELRMQKGQITSSITSKFQMHPTVSDLSPDGTNIVHCKICWDQNETILEDWYLFGQVHGQSKRELVDTSTFKATFTEPQIVFNKRELSMRVDMSPCGNKFRQTDEILVTNKSGVDLNVQLTIKSPFYIITEVENLIEKMKILLSDRSTMKVHVKFAPDMETDNLYSKSYRTALTFEYDEHPIKDKIKCEGYVNYPNLTLSSHEVKMACQIGCSEEYILTLTNNGPIPVESTEPSNTIETIPKFKNTSWQNENHMNNQTIGAGDALSDSLLTPMNSPVSNEPQTQRTNTNSEFDKILNESSKLEEEYDLLFEIKKLLMGVIDMPTTDESDIDVLEMIGYEPRFIEPINEILDIVQNEGIVLPYSSQNIHFAFHGFERIRIEVIAACKIIHGPTEMIQVNATADTVRYSIDKRVIDLGQQLFCESCNSNFNLTNDCRIAFTYTIISTFLLENNDGTDSNRLTIEPRKGIVEPKSSVKIKLNYRPIYLGPFNVEFRLKIAHLMPLIMSVTGVGIYPQVFLHLPQIIHVDKCPLELCYQALRSLYTEFIIEKNNVSSKNNEDNLINDWIMVSINETIPNMIDINMALERILASQFINENLYVLSKHNAAHLKSAIPQMFSLEYIIDLGNVVIGLTAHYSAMLSNYGPMIAEVKMRKFENKAALINSNIIVEFKKNVRLPVGHNILLHVTCSPTLAKYTEKKTTLKHTIYLEVTHGCTIPIIIQGVVTYPYITVYKKELNFNKVFIGECSMMHLTIKNEGLIDCDWSIEIVMKRKKQDYCPFSVHQEYDTYSPGHSSTIEVYFKPREPCYINAKLNIIVKMGLELQRITLMGHGIERKINLSESFIQFLPTIPYLDVQERELTIENNSEYPIEFFWHHLDDQFLHEDRIAKILTRYYNVEEILLPPRKLAQGIPPLLIEFYNELINEVTKEQRFDEMSDVEEGEEVEEEGREDDKKILNKEIETSITKKKKELKSTIRNLKLKRKGSNLKRKKSLTGSVTSLNTTKYHSSINDDLNLYNESSLLATNDPTQIEQLLLGYINRLQENPNFQEIMKDPVKCLFDQLEVESTLTEKLKESGKPLKKVCVIFHGAPFTAYQETACRSARALGIPVLSIDTVILEIAAFGKSECSVKLRQAINEIYQDYTTKFSEYRIKILAEKLETSRTETTRTQKSRSSRGKSRTPRTVETSKSEKRDEDSRDEERYLRWVDVPEPLESYNKLLLTEESLISMDIFSQYEHKLQAIKLLELILPSRIIAESIKDKISFQESEKSSKKKQESHFLNIDADLFSEVLKERLSEEEFERGFVLQTLQNIFIRDEIKTLNILLDIIGHIEFFLFITFHNSVDICNLKIDELKRLKTEKIAENTSKKIQEIDEMSLSDYDQISDEDKNIYLQAVLPIKRQEAYLRRAQLSQKLEELKRKKEERRMRFIESKFKKKKTKLTITKSKLTVMTNRDELESKTLPSKRGTARTKARTSPKLGKEILEIINVIGEYQNSLKAIENVITNLNFTQKNLQAEKNLARTDKLKEKTDQSREYRNIVQLHSLLADKRITEKLRSEPIIYSILAHKGFEVPNVVKTKPDTFELVSIATLHENPTTESFSSHTIKDPVQEATTTNIQFQNETKKRKKSKTKISKINFEEITTKVSTESGFLNFNSSNIDLYQEETLKPRLILRSNEKKQFKFRYRPLEMGDHKEIYTLSVVDNPNTTYRIEVNGISAVPKLEMNPRIIFPKIIEKKIDETNEPSFILDNGIFDFGSLVLNRKDKRAHRRVVEFTLKNLTPIEAEVSLHFKDHNLDGFNVQPEKLIIPAHEDKKLIVSAGVIKLGPHHNKLYICIKNNPRVEIIELRCYGTKLEIELDEKQLSFGRILLYRKENRFNTIRNKSTVPIFWHFECNEPLDAQITFTPKEGLLPPLKEQRIEFSYNASTVGVIENEINFQVFLNEDDEDPVHSEIMTISAETYDVLVDINYANPIDLKVVKVGHPINACFTMKNRGNYEIKYVIKFDEDVKLNENVARPTNVKKNLEINPTSGSIQAQKTINVQMTFLPKIEIRLKEAPILKCHIIDANNQTMIVAEFPLTVSLLAYYNRFNLNPYPDINFGTIPICTKKIMYLDIENTGGFTFRYSIQIPPRSIFFTVNVKKEEKTSKRKDTGRDTEIVSKRDKKSTKTDKTDTNINKTLNIGPFTLTKFEADVEAGQIDTITIECYPEIVGSQEEQIIVFVPDTVMEYKDGKNVTLCVDSCIPSIDFTNFDNMFRNNHIVDNIEDFLCPKEIGAHTVFARQTKCLHFRRVTMSSVHMSCFELHNRGIVPADIEIKAFVKSPSNAKPTTFVVEPQKERIPAHSHKRINITFAPALINTYHGYLEIKLSLPKHLDEEKWIIDLIGESCVPEITIIEPPAISGIRDGPIIRFHRTLVEETSIDKFAFQNIGLVQATIIVEIYDDPNTIFSFSASTETQILLRSTMDFVDDGVRDNRYVVVRTMPQDVASFEVKFYPKDIGKYTARIRLFVVDNPYDNLIINLEGESFIELIVLQDLELLNFKSDNRRESNSKKQKLSSTLSLVTDPIPPVFLSYKLDYGTCHINKMYKKTFKITNKSLNRYFRFQWTAHPNVVFVPSIGHLQHSTSKQITATLLESEPKKHDGTKLECVVNQIEMSSNMGETSWDDRETIVRWEKIDIPDINKEDSLSKKSVEPTIEPEHNTIPGTTKCILLLMNAIVGYSEYLSTASEINFKDTLMFQKREYTFTLSNPSNVNTNYIWVINMDEEYPKRISGSTVRLSEKSRSRKSRSRPGSRSSRGVLYPTEDNYSDNLGLHRCKPLSSHEPFLDIKPQPCTCKGSDLYSSTACLTDRSTDSWLEGEDLPFKIVPETGTMLPGESVEYILTFSPRDVFDYKAYLNCKIENLNPKLTELVIPIKARSVLPYCHFDVPESDYIISGKRDQKLPGPIGYSTIDKIVENIKVIELNVIGVGNVHTKKFPMINPTADNYHFSWKDHTPYSINEVSNFQCLTSEGIAERGKQTEMAFTFLSTDIGIYESFWMFSIEQYDLKCLFLFVAIVKEPVIYCTSPHLKMKPTVLDLEVQDSVSIINKEDFNISFKISEESLYSEGHYQNITVTPMNGVLKANDQQTFWINYKPTLIGEFQFSIQCILKFLRNPLVFFVTTITYNIMPCVTYTNTKGEDIKLLDHQDNIVDFGKVVPKRSNIIKFKIINSGNVTFYYTWDVGMTAEIISMNAYTISMPQKKGHVTSESHETCCLTLIAKRKMFIKNHNVTLKISKGPTYQLILKAIVGKSPIELSFHRYDFGPCYVRELDSSPYRTELRVSNGENKPLVLECKFEERPHMSINLNGLSQAIAAKSNISIPIIFRPLQETYYEETITFLINSTIEENVKIVGEGIIYKIRLVNSRDKIIELGNLPVHKTLIKKVPVINEGRAPVDLKFDLISNLSGDKRYFQKVPAICIPRTFDEIIKSQERVSQLETKRSNTDDMNLQMDATYATQALTIEPSELTRVRPNEKINLTIKFKPTSRIKMFTQKIGAMVDSTLLSLFILRGSCIGPEFRLNKTYIAFGTVVHGCIGEIGLVLMNTGDIGAKFTWDLSNMPLDFTILPKSGYSSPGTNVHFIVKFEPIREGNVIEGYVSLIISVVKVQGLIISQATIVIEKYDSVRIKISGACTKLPDPIETLSFTTIVRSKQSKSVNVFNDSVLPWKLKPEITGDYFYVDNILNIPPEESTSCIVTYQPLVMNTEDNLHKGTLLFKLPDNKEPLLYSLRGHSLPPQAITTIIRQFPAKMRYTELLPVYNWMNRHQRFKCIIEAIEEKKLSQQESNNIPMYSFTGNNNIDVPENNQRDYRAIFHSYKESYFRFKITFINEDGEYQYYEIQYTITKPEVIESIKLITNVRSSICHMLQLHNPLKEIPVSFTINCQHPGITIYDVPTNIPPLSSEFITINYYPILTSEETIEKLDINCPELGHFPYELRLTALPPATEKTTHVTAILGNSIKFSLPIKNVTSKRADFVIEVNNNSFICPKKIDIEGLRQGSIDVIYEPHDIENSTAILTATSKLAGIFTYPIIGTYLLPKPQGPYTMTLNSPVAIKFKNIFKETKTFEFLANNSLDFEIKPTSQAINPKQEINIVVNLRQRNDSENEFYEKCPVTGKLSVFCTDPKLSHVVWIYYLREIIE